MLINTNIYTSAQGENKWIENLGVREENLWAGRQSHSSCLARLSDLSKYVPHNLLPADSVKTLILKLTHDFSLLKMRNGKRVNEDERKKAREQRC